MKCNDLIRGRGDLRDRILRQEGEHPLLTLIILPKVTYSNIIRYNPKTYPTTAAIYQPAVKPVQGRRLFTILEKRF